MEPVTPTMMVLRFAGMVQSRSNLRLQLALRKHDRAKILKILLRGAADDVIAVFVARLHFGFGIAQADRELLRVFGAPLEEALAQHVHARGHQEHVRRWRRGFFHAVSRGSSLRPGCPHRATRRRRVRGWRARSRATCRSGCQIPPRIPGNRRFAHAFQIPAFAKRNSPAHALRRGAAGGWCKKWNTRNPAYAGASCGAWSFPRRRGRKG